MKVYFILIVTSLFWNSTSALPVVSNKIDRQIAFEGHLFSLKIPKDTFHNPNKLKLSLSLKTKDNKELSPKHWLQFDSKNEEIYGVPKIGDSGSNEYMLVAKEAGGLSATHDILVQVNPAPIKEYIAFFKAYLDISYEQFTGGLQRKFIERIAKFFGDALPKNIQIRSVNALNDSHGTIVGFYNTTLFRSPNRCPEKEMEALRSTYNLENVKKSLDSEFKITNVTVVILDSCHAQIDKTRDYMYTVFIPIIIIETVVLIVSIIYCLLYRRRRKSVEKKLGQQDKEESIALQSSSSV